jgi:BirA family transcriptional regulator, biotin operon repressor / biotin---[acetyl-CoA-carboxylase] ligase
MPLDIETIANCRPENQFHYFQSIDSTMREASRLAASGAPHGTVVVADEQTAGIGRLGRSWVSQPGLGVYCSVLLRLKLKPASLPVASLVVGLAAAEAIQKATQLACDLRWPNDVLIHEKKVAGILTHLVDGCIVGGIGINVNQPALPEGLRTPATSLLIENNGRRQSREQIIIKLLESLDTFCEMLQADGPGVIIRAFTSASSYAANRRVLIEDTGRKGITAGLDENGFLLVRHESGRVEKIASGGVRPDLSA